MQAETQGKPRPGVNTRSHQVTQGKNMTDEPNNPPRELGAEEKRGRGRLPGFKMTEEHRAKIRNSNILNALIEHVVNGREMSPSQVTAGLGLIRKVLPDLSATTISGDEDGDPIKIVGTIERRLVKPNAGN
jgi:hypothetical protein